MIKLDYVDSLAQEGQEIVVDKKNKRTGSDLEYFTQGNCRYLFIFCREGRTGKALISDWDAISTRCTAATNSLNWIRRYARINRLWLRCRSTNWSWSWSWIRRRKRGWNSNGARSCSNSKCRRNKFKSDG